MVNYKLCNQCYEGVLPGFYIFKSEKLKDDYIKFYKPGTCMAMKKKKQKWLPSYLRNFYLSLKGQFQVGCHYQ